MSENSLGNIDLSPDGVATTPDEAIDLFHDPDLAYYAIQNAAEINEDLNIAVDEDVAAEEVVLREKVNVFQQVMQYSEAFGIYFLSYLKGREDLLNDLIQTEPKNVKQFFESLEEDGVNEYLDDRGIEDEYTELLKYWFGYRFIDEEADVQDVIDWEQFSVDSINALVDQSIEILQSDLASIAQFYLRFDGVYNAVKHGDRVIIGVDSEISVEAEGEVLDSFENTDFVGFICREENSPFLVTLPVEHLFDEALVIASKVRRLFNYSKEVSEALIHEDSEETDLSITFLERDSDEDGGGTEWVKGSTDGGIMIVPKTDELRRAIAESPTGTFAGRLEVDGDTLVVRTVRDDKRSPEYPVEVTLRHEGAVGLSSQRQIDTSFSFTPTEIDVVQYAELLKLQEREIDTIQVVDEVEEIAFDSEDLTGLNGEQTPVFVDQEYSEFLALSQEIIQERIPAPIHLSDEQEAVLEKAVDRGTSNMDREGVAEIVSELEDLGADRVYTTVWVELVTPERDVLLQENVAQFEDSLSFDATVENPEDVPEIEEEDFEVDAGVDRTLQGTVRGYPVSFQGLIRQLSDDLNRLYDVFGLLGEQEEGAESLSPTLYIEYETNEEGFWSTENLVRLQVVHWEQCPLCQEFVETTADKHLRHRCEPESPVE